MTLPIVILAGGEGRRIGGGKPGRLLAGRSLLDHALMKARRWSACIAVAVRAPDQVQAGGVRLLVDAPEAAGPLAGLASALDWAAQEGCGRVLVIPCDMPFLPDDLTGRLAARLDPGKGVAAATSGGRLHPACALWRTSARPLLDDQLRLGRLSLTALAQRCGCVAVEWAAEPHDPFVNVNSPVDLALAEGRMAAAATG